MMKRGIALAAVVAVVLTGCGSDGKQKEEKTELVQQQEKQYVEDTIAVLPEEDMYEEELLLTTDLQTNQEGEPALYQFIEETDDTGDEFAAVVEYSLNSDGNWKTKNIGRKDIQKRVKNEMQHNLAFPFIQRGDDGNLYVLVKCFDDEDYGMGADPSEKAYCAYSVMAIDEEKDECHEVKLQTKAVDDQGEEIDYAREFDVTNFHVMEDGTFFLVFSGASALWFDGTTGTQTNVCTSIPDSAFGKSVAYGENGILYFSSSSKMFGILDSDSLEVASNFGKDMPEENRKYDWRFDTDTTTWETYAFNPSGLYRISDFGKKASAQLLSSRGNFDSLADANIYDILVGAKEELYVLVRLPQQAEDGEAGLYQFGIIKYQAES